MFKIGNKVKLTELGAGYYFGLDSSWSKLVFTVSGIGTDGSITVYTNEALSGSKYRTFSNMDSDMFKLVVPKKPRNLPAWW